LAFHIKTQCLFNFLSVAVINCKYIPAVKHHLQVEMSYPLYANSYIPTRIVVLWEKPEHFVYDFDACAEALA